MQNFPTMTELQAMPVVSLRNLNITTKEEELMVQGILDKKMSKLPPVQLVYRGDVPFHITNKDEEDKWQKIIDERTAALLPKSEEVILDEMLTEKTVELESIKENIKTSTRFCDFCDSKGVRHKKVCTRTK